MSQNHPTVRAASVALASLLGGVLPSQAADPALTYDGTSLLLTIPYLEFGSGSAKQAYAASLSSTDGRAFTLNAASVKAQSVLSMATDVATFTAGPGATYTLTLPYVGFINGVELPYKARFTSSDLLKFTPDPAALGLSTAQASLALTLTQSYTMPVNTHRPEVLVTNGGDILMAVVAPDGAAGVGQVKHKAYLYDTGFKQKGKEFPLTATTSAYGEPADHRAILVNNQLVVVYQTLRLKDGVTVVTGATEDFAKDQSLMMARFSLDGTELFRGPIVANATDFAQDTFPDHCLTWLGDRLLLATGMGYDGSKARTKLREVDLNGNILKTTILSGDNQLNPIGNSLLFDGSDVRLLSYAIAPTNNLLLHTLNSSYAISSSLKFGDSTLEQEFTTGNLYYKGNLFLAHIARASGGDLSLTKNPYYPYLKIISPSGALVSSTKLSTTPGFSHVHPTIARKDDKLYVAWSQQYMAPGSMQAAPQVNIAEFAISLSQ